MNATISLKLFDITQEFIKDKDKVREFVSKIEETIDNKFQTEKSVLASKTDLAEMKTRINKTICIVGLVQFLAIVGSVLAIVNFMLK
jgi:hypothetical protein